LNPRLITSMLISFSLFLSGHCYGSTSSLQCDQSSEKAGSNTVTTKQGIKPLIHALIEDSLQPFSGSVILLESGIPVLELRKGEGINKDSRFVMASLSKQITATLILQAVDAGKLDLDSSLNRLLFDNDTPDKIKTLNSIGQSSAQSSDLTIANRYDERITVHHLLSHTSGVDEPGKPHRFEPGSQFEYSNFGYSLLGQILEKVNRQSFAKQVAEFSNLYQLKGLHAEVGNVDSIRTKVTSLAVGLNETDVIAPSNLVINESLLPAGGLIASAAAFAKFQHKLHSGKLMSPESYTLMTRSYTKIKFLWPDMSYGYGLRINSDNGLVEYSHTGYLPGYMSMSLHYPEFNLDLVMLENLSLNLNDLKRVFELHSGIRQAIRGHLLLTKSKLSTSCQLKQAATVSNSLSAKTGATRD
jgi:CubicO group peptidase (beta-lactamase class C family)